MPSPVRRAARGCWRHWSEGTCFVVPLDDKRQWYRYHHLFADVLHAHSMEEQPDRIPTLHRRASAWYEQNGLPSDAIRHALAAEDFERAADLVELAWTALQGTREDATWLGWAKALPDELVRTRPVLSVGYAWTLLVGGKIEAGEARLRDAERWLDSTARGRERQAEMVVVNEKEFRSLPGTIASARAFHAQAIGDVPGTMKYSRQAFELLPEDNYIQRAIAGGVLGRAHWTSGELDAAHRLINDSGAQVLKSGNVAFAIKWHTYPSCHQCDPGSSQRGGPYIRRSHCCLPRSRAGPSYRDRANLFLGLSELQLERGDLEGARELLLRSADLVEEAAYEVYEYRSRIAKARIKEAEGDLGRRSRSPRRRGAREYRGPCPRSASRHGAENAGVGCAGQVDRSPELGAQAGPLRRRRPQLPARVRAHHAG